MSSKDALVEVPFDRWADLRDAYGRNGTISVPYYQTLQVNMAYPELREALQLKLYCPYGDTSEGVILISAKGHTELAIMPLTNDNQKLTQALQDTKLINWSRKITVNILCPRAVDVLRVLQTKISLTTCNILPTTTFYYDKNRILFSELTLPDDVYLSPIKLEDITQVDNSWPYKYAASHFYFTVLTKCNLSYGIYSKEDNILRAWVFFNEYYFICNLYCVETFRGSGHGKMLVKYLVNEKLKKGEGAYALVVEGNKVSYNLFKKMNFEIIEPSYYAYIQK